MSSSNQDQSGFALVLSAGGARAAYQVGLLRELARQIPSLSPTIYSGISAGSINATFLAQGQSFPEGTERMYELWKELVIGDVLKTNFRTIFGVLRKLIYDLSFGRVTKRPLTTSLLDATPLAQTLTTNIQFPRIARAVREGILEGVAVSTTNYNTGSNTVFYDSHENIEPWHRPRRSSVRSPLRIRHIMASCSIPILFEPVRIGESFYGDGALRFRFPLSPAIHLGAKKILAVGISAARANVHEEHTPSSQKKLSMGMVAGVVLNSIFIDSLEFDAQHLQHCNEIVGSGSRFRKISSLVLRPSQDLGVLAGEHISELPFHFRQLIKASGRSSGELGDLLSYLMFTPGYIKALADLGARDANAQLETVKSFVDA